MNRVAIAFLTKDRTHLSWQTITPLLQPDKFDLFWIDGSVTEEGQAMPTAVSLAQPSRHGIKQHLNVRGGPDAAVAYALTVMLNGTDYDYVGLCENDVLLHPDWFGPTFALFERGHADGLTVGAVSARCFEDRILIQRDGYAVVHNLGWGMQIMSRAAALHALRYMRTGMTTENVNAFCALSSVDISRYWAFRHGEHMLCADWQNDRILATSGFSSLALVPSPVEMIGQDPPLEEQGLKIADAPVELLASDHAWGAYVRAMNAISSGEQVIPAPFAIYHNGAWTYFPHQLPNIGGRYVGPWRLKWTQGFGPFSWRADDWKAGQSPPYVVVPIMGPVDFLVSGGADGGKWRVEDLASGYVIEPVLNPEPPGQGFVSLPVATRIPYRLVRLTALTPGVVFYGLRTQDMQTLHPGIEFNWHTLPSV